MTSGRFHDDPQAINAVTYDEDGMYTAVDFTVPANAITDPVGGAAITDPDGGAYITDPGA